MDMIKLERSHYKDGEPCDHKGCLNHVSHPCEGCGRIAGQTQVNLKDNFNDYTGNIFINFHKYMKQKYTRAVLNDNTIKYIESDVHRFTERCVEYGIINFEFKQQFIEFILSIIAIR